MRRLLRIKEIIIIFILVAIISCDSDTPEFAEGCTEEETRCEKNIIQKCVNGKWNEIMDCTKHQKVCSIIDGEAYCMDNLTIDAGSDVDNDSDGDSDTDNDSDSDTDSDTDSDIDADSDVDSDIDSDSDTDADNDADSDADGGGDCNGWYDSLNSLCWENPPGGQFDWDEAILHCSGLGIGWRVPKIQELISLVRGCDLSECGVIDPDCLSWEASCLENCTGCPNYQGPGKDGCYWDYELDGTCTLYLSSSLQSDNPINVWNVNFISGDVFTNENVGDFWVRCVR